MRVKSQRSKKGMARTWDNVGGKEGRGREGGKREGGEHV